MWLFEIQSRSDSFISQSTFSSEEKENELVPFLFCFLLPGPDLGGSNEVSRQERGRVHVRARPVIIDLVNDEEFHSLILQSSFGY